MSNLWHFRQIGFKATAWTALLLLGVASSRADILFLDLNNSPSEVEAAQRAADARGENLIVIPELSSETLSDLKSTRQAVKQASRDESRACGKAGVSTGCQDAKSHLQAVKAANEKVMAAIPKMKFAELNQQLANIRGAKINLSSVIISGHHTDKDFWGISASLNQEQIEKAFQINKPVGEHVRSLYLWACYAATTDDFLKNWKKGFPNTTMIAGFDGQAPSSVRTSSGLLLEDLLAKEKALNEARDQGEIKDVFNSLTEINHVKAQICMNRETVVSRNGVRTVEDDVRACGHQSSLETKYTEIYNCYLHAEDGCETLPDSENETNPLRRAYDYFQETRHCDEALNVNGQPREATQSQVRRLLFDNQIRFSFEKLTSRQLQQMNALMDRLGLPKDLHLKNIWTLSRKEYVDKINGIKTAYNSLADRARDARGRVADINVLALGNDLKQIDKFHNGDCVPLEWVEMDPNVSDSSCGIQRGMQNAMKDAQAEITAQAGD